MSDEPQFLDFKCPYCRDTVSFTQELAGAAQECPNCFESLVVPHELQEFANPVPVPIRTPRLLLRRLVAGDYKDLEEILGDEETFRYVASLPQDDQSILKWLDADALVKITSPNTTFSLGLESATDQKVIGIIYLHISDERNQATIWTYVNRKFQRQGLGTEAMNAVLGFCFNGIGLHRVSAASNSQNAAACRMCEKAGMRREGEFIKDVWQNGGWANTVWFGILAEEHAAARRTPA